MRLSALVGEVDGLRPCIVRQERDRETQRAKRASALQELAAVDAPVAVLVVKREDLLVDLGLGNGAHGSPRSCRSMEMPEVGRSIKPDSRPGSQHARAAGRR